MSEPNHSTITVAITLILEKGRLNTLYSCFKTLYPPRMNPQYLHVTVHAILRRLLETADVIVGNSSG